MSKSLLSKYRFIKDIVCDYGFDDEIDWQSNIDFNEVDERTFLGEFAWVVLSSGMRERVVRNLFGEISRCFYDWISAKIIVEHKNECLREALRYFNNKPKMNAIVEAASKIIDVGFDKFKDYISRDPIKRLQELSYIGPVTVFHLAKNIGLNVAKPDRHLVRIANLEGYADVQIFCHDIAEMSGDSIPVVDIVYWRFATIEKDYLNILSTI